MEFPTGTTGDIRPVEPLEETAANVRSIGDYQRAICQLLRKFVEQIA
jgi:hypothetical protein